MALRSHRCGIRSCCTHTPTCPCLMATASGIRSGNGYVRGRPSALAQVRFHAPWAEGRHACTTNRAPRRVTRWADLGSARVSLPSRVAVGAGPHERGNAPLGAANSPLWVISSPECDAAVRPCAGTAMSTLPASGALFDLAMSSRTAASTARVACICAAASIWSERPRKAGSDWPAARGPCRRQVSGCAPSVVQRAPVSPSDVVGAPSGVHEPGATAPAHHGDGAEAEAEAARVGGGDPGG